MGDGLYYYGELKNTYLHGKGIIRDENNKIIYDGDFKFGKNDGEGSLHYIGGNHYIGEFRNGVQYGNGILLDKEIINI